MSVTKVILIKDVYKLGEEGDVRDVKRGYARNYLIPQGFAVDYTLQNRNTLAKRSAAIEKKKLQKKENAGALKVKLEAEEILVKIPAGEKGRLYGTVTTAQIVEELSAKGYKIDKRSLELSDHIKVTGKYKVSAHLYNDIYAEIPLVVEGIVEEKKNEGRRPARKRKDETAEAAAEKTVSAAEKTSAASEAE
ncbi:MAG: 50S ribosomal protein L9 [Spirochaetales bacterium]|nr:50S ribosomal protein L9 [Spirochaetales bacterium]